MGQDQARPSCQMSLPPVVAATFGTEAWLGDGVLEAHTLQGSYPLVREGTS